MATISCGIVGYLLCNHQGPFKKVWGLGFGA